MNWRFWKKEQTKDETEISITIANLSSSQQIYVKAQTSDKAFDLYNKLKKEESK